MLKAKKLYIKFICPYSWWAGGGGVGGLDEGRKRKSKMKFKIEKNQNKEFSAQ